MNRPIVRRGCRWLAALAVGGALAIWAAQAPAAMKASTAATAASHRPTEDIRDIHGPILIAGPRSQWPCLIGAGCVAASLAGIVVYRRRRRPPSTPAALALAALEAARPLADGEARGFSFAVSEIVRRYVEEAFSLRAAHRTTDELLADLMGDQSPVAAHRAPLGEFLRLCDLAKFAGWSLSRAEMAAMSASAEAFVRATDPTAAAARDRAKAAGPTSKPSTLGPGRGTTSSHQQPEGIVT
jgi:hypothetical protein